VAKPSRRSHRKPAQKTNRALEGRVRRLLNYRRPRLKFLLAKVFRTTAAAALIATAFFLIQFHLQGHQVRIEKSSICMEAFLSD